VSSTRRRLTIALVAVIALALAALVPWQLRDMRPRYLATMEETMVDGANLLAEAAASASRDGRLDGAALRTLFGGPAGRLVGARIYALDKQTVDAWITVTDGRGMVLLDGEDPAAVGADHARWRDVARTLRGEYGARTTWEDRGDGPEEVLHVAAPVRDHGRLVGVLTLSKPARSVGLVVEQARSAALLAVLATAVAMLVLGLLITWWLTRPIARLTGHVRDLQAGRRAPLPPLGASDLVALGTAFEAMRDALDGRSYVEAYVQTLTHEMKSPLAAMRAAAELLGEELPEADRRRFLANLGSEVARLHDLIERLLQLSALERRRALERPEAIDLRALCAEVVDSLAASARSRGVSVAIAPGGPAPIRGERFLVRQAIANLVQNALDFSPRQGAVAIAIARREGDWVLTVDDDGPGLPDYAVARVFERFFSLPRPDSGRKGTGLGLALVREVATLHGGSATLTGRAAGGARATVTLPAT
jgi:two-component system sensor histidine kinase CreC